MGLRRLPLRIRLVAGFAAAMLLVLTGAAGFVYLRVRYALDLRLDEDLTAQTNAIVEAIHTATLPDPTHDPMVIAGGYYQVLDPTGTVLTASPALPATQLLTPQQLATARQRPLRFDRGTLLPISTNPLRVAASPLDGAATAGPGQPAVVIVAVRRDQRDEALRELIGQLALANLGALTLACLVGYRLARAALDPVERYRTEAARIAAGAVGVRLAVPETHDEIARLGHTLNDMLTALETALERERRFVCDASHELRTPLTLLATELELALRRPRTTAELETAIRAAAGDTTDLIALADSLLAVGIQPDQHDTTPIIDLALLLAGRLDRYRQTTGTTEITLHQPTGAAYLHGDATRLGQAITNLLDNALRHGRPPITVTLTVTQGVIHLTVHDSGAGIDATFLPHATERFTRADTARNAPGTGLGLSLVEAIVHAHHGELRLCSTGVHHRSRGTFPLECAHPIDGTTASILLPVAGEPNTVELASATTRR